jgi:hypothetical protein
MNCRPACNRSGQPKEKSVSAKPFVKTLLLGPPGVRPRDIKLGLLRGIRFNIDTSSKSSRLLGLYELEITQALRTHAAEACRRGRADPSQD